jgi:release factor glutamine methyltransferase
LGDSFRLGSLRSERTQGHRKEAGTISGDLSDERMRVVVAALAEAGFLAPDAEAEALSAASVDAGPPIEELLARRLGGAPLAWITGAVDFCGLRVHIDPGVFVPRPHTRALARRAVSLLPSTGIAVDLCTGSGAVAAVLASACPDATVLATDIDPLAVACARRNGVRALLGDLDEPLPPPLRGQVDVITAVVPYVPTDELPFLPRDVVANEPSRALDGGPDGTAVLVRAADVAARWLRPGGGVLLELGGDQPEEMSRSLTALGFSEISLHQDEEGQARAIEARRPIVTERSGDPGSSARRRSSRWRPGPTTQTSRR